ncbi:hypothetical protein A9308_04110 [Moraxella atlantae]|uniref:Uncharacterized protein n=1 Tax=Faucicola atlantae TaxID=34059 RepID=A0A1B8QEI3_9GAMM|nr:hypothetical protein A9308_04110 [Moraxella atlantae]
MFITKKLDIGQAKLIEKIFHTPITDTPISSKLLQGCNKRCVKLKRKSVPMKRYGLAIFILLFLFYRALKFLFK